MHLFNSSIVSGPEVLVLGNLTHAPSTLKTAIFLTETRLSEKTLSVLTYAKNLGFNPISVPVSSRVDRQAIAALAKVLEELKPAAAHSHDVKASFYLYCASKVLRNSNPNHRLRLISTHHGIRGRPDFTSKLYERIYSHFILPNFDRTLCVCNSDRQILLSRGLDSTKTVTHLNGVTRPKVHPIDRSEAAEKITSMWRESKGLPFPSPNKKPFILGMVGRYSAEKRHTLALQVLSIVKAKRPDLNWEFFCFGSGALEKQLYEETIKYQLQNQVHWMGYRGSIGQELAGFDLLLSLSFAEGLPINLIEAGWAATPVLTTWVDGNRDLLPNPDYGVLIQPYAPIEEIAAKLIEVMENPNQAKKMGALLQKRVESEFSAQRWMDNLARIYSDLNIKTALPSKVEITQ